MPLDAARTGSDELLAAYRGVRGRSLRLAAPLSAEDQGAQSMPDASPTKWHLAHSSWFFETFLLCGYGAEYAVFDEAFSYIFNSYYEAVGARHARPERGLLTRPSLEHVLAYRAHVDEGMERLLAGSLNAEATDLIHLGLAHEEQHQELMLMDILHLFGGSPLEPAYAPDGPRPASASAPAQWVSCDGGLVEIGADALGFSFDNEGPRHRQFLSRFQLSSRLVTNAEWMRFMEAEGYQRPEFWHADGWARVQAEGWRAPLYWTSQDGAWRTLTLAGPALVDPSAPVSHISFFEAAAFAAWAGARLPTEGEWEHAIETRRDRFEQVDESLWQWTASAYLPYPGFATAAGAVGEYNGKFMVGQMVLRGGACVTPPGHVRPSYRNFFYPHQRWMFSGVRLARDEPGPADEAEAFRSDVMAGLRAPRKWLLAKWFYDARGSDLFEEITRLPEYYPTRQEIALLQDIAPQLSAAIPAGAVLVELGSGASVKTRRLLDHAPQIAVYAPLDISPTALDAGAAAIARDYPALRVSPSVGDFAHPERLVRALPPGPKVGFFPGSTIGNFAPEDSIALLRRWRTALGEDGVFIVGLDLAKDPEVMRVAYDDTGGVTAAFNLNILRRINAELDGSFDLQGFRHRAVWNEMEGRMEMHLQALTRQTVRVAGEDIAFTPGETIHTENSYKPTGEAFEALAKRAGWTVLQQWRSPDPAVAVFLLGA